ncbi:Protein THYLAKOID FORMATION 1, chloroplastic [Salvia divinorum]|uniref:Protein THYLAKOID FORMATION 1, chloroplastic n=1 Tax=Salvia divinorum TaxID=28513 RepID=A0ABD1HGK7_SALDI
MAAVASVSFASIAQSTDRKFPIPSSHRCSASNFSSLKLRSPGGSCTFRSRSFRRGAAVHFMSSAADPPTVADTKLNFLKAYKRPIPSIYNTVLQELIVQQHLTRYKKSYRYDPVFALGFVTVYDQLMEGYPSDEDREAIFKAYVEALNEDPAQYRVDAQKVEEWARSQSAATLVDFASREGEVEDVLKDISERAESKGSFSYSRFFAVGLFRLLELSNATEPTILNKLCGALNVDKKSVDRDLDVYRNLLSKLVQAKELLREYVDREKKKVEERAATQKANEAVKTMLGVGGVAI